MRATARVRTAGTPTTRTRETRTRAFGVFAIAATLLAACGSGGSANGSVTLPTSPPRVEVVATAPAPATTVSVTIPPTTVETTVPETVPDTTIPPSTVPPTTPAPQPPPSSSANLPRPVAAPSDSRGKEAVVQLGTIEIPKIGLSTTLYEGIRLTTLDRGPGHWPGTAMPGAAGNVVVAGHRTSHARPFRNIDQLQPGDQVIFTTADGRFVYAVTSTEFVAPDAIRIIDQTGGKTATLFACHPPGSTRQRIVVHLEIVGA